MNFVSFLKLLGSVNFTIPIFQLTFAAHIVMFTANISQLPHPPFPPVVQIQHFF
jgi:hypothetical protein